MPEGDYAGDISCAEAWQILAETPDSVLVDVRTSVEWQLIGKPDLTTLNKEPVYLQWVTMEGMNPAFMTELKVALAKRNVQPETPLVFVCQSGGRSKMAAMQCTAEGFARCYNLVEGFEGDLDEQQHRNSVNGWKVAGLPWTQK